MLLLLTSALLAAEPSLTAAEGPTPLRGQAAMAPAVLPSGALSLFALMGAPELGAGYRQGFRTFELDATITVNYLQLSTNGELALRLRAYEQGRFQLGATVGLGLTANSGSTYYDPLNFGFVGLRPRMALVGSMQFTDAVAALATAELPLAIGLSSAGVQALPSVGAGAEVSIAGGLSLLALGQVGVDASRSPQGVSQARLGWALRLGLGFRLF